MKLSVTDITVVFECPNCKKEFEVLEYYRKPKVECPFCQGVFKNPLGKD